MDIYLLDANRQREHIVDRFYSFIWTERYAEYGDCEISLHSTAFNRDIFVEGRWITQNKSFRVMVLDTIEDEEDADGKQILLVKGKSLEAIFQERLAAYGKEQLQLGKKWEIKGTPGDILRYIFLTVCVEGILDERDIIPNVSMDAFPYQGTGTMNEPSREVTIETEIKSIYDVFVDVCTTYHIGFRLLMDPETQILYFEVLTGTNRTSAQTAVSPLVFSPEMENLVKSKELRSTAQYKNVAVVTSEYGSVEVYADGDAGKLYGFDRRVLHVRGDIKQDDVNKEALMRQQGLVELAKNRRVLALDGEIPETGHRYSVDYFLGDIVEMRKNSGPINYMRVVEQISVDDAEGERSYPTLSLDSYITPGSWYGQPIDVAWHDKPHGLVWRDMPKSK